MKKILLIIAFLVIPCVEAEAQDFFETKSGVSINQETLEFIKEFGYSENMIYHMSEEELNMFKSADLSSVVISKIDLPDPNYFDNSKITRDATMTTTYKTITGALFYNTSYNRYQFFASLDFHTIPSDSKKSLDFLFLNWGTGATNNYFQVSGYYVTSSNSVVRFENSGGIKPNAGEYGILNGVSLSSSLNGINFLIPEGEGVTDCTIGIARGFSNQPTSTKVENLEQYYNTPIINSIAMQYITEVNNKAIVNNENITNQLTRFSLNVKLREE